MIRITYWKRQYGIPTRPEGKNIKDVIEVYEFCRYKDFLFYAKAEFDNCFGIHFVQDFILLTDVVKIEKQIKDLTIDEILTLKKDRDFEELLGKDFKAFNTKKNQYIDITKNGMKKYVRVM
mgnify:CR=1 FL=1